MTLFRGRRIPKTVKVLRAERPSVAIETRYRRDLDRMIREMHDSVIYWLTSAYRNNEPRIAQDATPSEVLRIAVSRLAARWQARFDEASERLAEYFAKDAERRSSTELYRILKKGGWTVKFQMTPAMRDVFDATINANVQLIKSIPQQYLSDVEGMVQRSIQQGRNLKQLTDDIEHRYGLTRNRATLIARDQNNKANAAFTRVRRLEVGITQAVWMHSHGGDVPRKSHVAMNGKPFDVAKGMWDSTEQEYVQPGQLINCRCVSRPVVEGFQ